VSYAVRFTPRAAQQVGKLAPAVANRIRIFLEQEPARLDNPCSLGKKLVSEEFWRYRVGDYRILTHINDDQILILVVGGHTAAGFTTSSEH